MPKIKLKPCPFCGSAAKIRIEAVRGLSQDYIRYSVYCPECRIEKYHDLASGSSFDAGDAVLDKVIEGWNKRINTDNLANHVDTEIAKTTEQAALNRSTLGYQRKNLFNFSAWLDSIGTTLNNGTLTATSNSITLTATGNDCYTLNFNALINSKLFRIPVHSSTKYVLSWVANNDLSGRVAVFFNGDINPNSGNIQSAYNNITKKLEFITKSDTKFITLRIGVANTGDTITYSNIMLRPAEITDDTYEPYKPSVEERLAALEEKFAALGGVEHNAVHHNAFNRDRTCCSRLSYRYHQSLL